MRLYLFMGVSGIVTRDVHLHICLKADWISGTANSIQRDKNVLAQLEERKIRCLVVWECTIKQAQKKNGDPHLILKAIEDFLLSEKQYQEI